MKIDKTAFTKLYDILKSESSISTFTVTEATYMYHAQIEPIMRVHLTFNLDKVTAEQCDKTADYLAKRLAMEFAQEVIPCFRHQSMLIVDSK